MINDGKLVPNAELGHIELDGHDAETRASVRAREREDLSWKQYGKRLHCGQRGIRPGLQPLRLGTLTSQQGSQRIQQRDCPFSAKGPGLQ